jgi:tetratricopeptide (TPR) repeat protein
MSARAARSSFYVLGGTLNRDSPSYVMRDADLDLHAAIARGEFCYVLTSRQMGKSSLMVRMVVRLRQEGVRAVVIDLTALGQNLTPEQWYLGLLDCVGSQLGLEDDLARYWDSHASFSPLQRWLGGIRDVALGDTGAPLVIFVDEIDAIRSLPFPADEFFAAIREVYNARSDVPELQRLTFCLLGVATPSDLIQDMRTSPFNIGHRIELTDFTEKEALVLLPGLARAGPAAPTLLRRILFWTGGHPYLTQRLCQAVVDDRRVKNPSGVDRVSNETFFSPAASERDDNLLFVQDRMLRGSVNPVELLAIHSNIQNGSLIKDDPANPLFNELRLAGVVRSEKGYLRVRNRIYVRVFNEKWVEANQPLDEVQRQRAAERRGRRKAMLVAAPIVVVFASLAILALWLYHKASLESQKAQKFADSALALTSNVVNETYAASTNRPELLGIYRKIVQAANPFLETILNSEPKNAAAANLKANSLYVAVDEAIRRGDQAEARSRSQESLALADSLLKTAPDIRRRAIAARLYAAAAEAFSKLGDSTEAEVDLEKAEKVAQDVSRQVKPDDEFTMLSLSTTYNMLRAAEEGMDHWDRAVQSYQRDGKDDDGRMFQVVHDALEARNRTAQIEFENHQYDAARKVLEERSLSIANTLVEWNDKPERQRTDAQRNQARMDLWDVQDKLGRVSAVQKSTWPDALKYLGQAMDTGEKVVRADPSLSNRQKLEDQVASVARIQKLLGMTQGAMQSYVRFVALVRQRATAEPGDESAAKMGDACQQLAEFEAHHGNKSVAPADYETALEWFSKVGKKDATLEREIASVNLKLADVQSDFGQTDQARGHYREALRLGERSLELDHKNNRANDVSVQLLLASEYQDLAFARLGLSDRKGASDVLARLLDQAKTAANLAQASLEKNKSPETVTGAAFAYGTLGWAELLNNHPQESIRASRAALSLDDKQAWIHANLAHAYLMANQADQAKALYQAHRGEEMYDDIFEVSVLDDFAQLRKLGFDRPAMAEVEKLLGK